MLEAAALSWVTAERARRAVIDLAKTIAPAGGRLLAIKGVHLAFCVAPEPTFRPMGDADALVIGIGFDEAVARCTGGGWTITSDNWSTKGLTRASSGTVDLHRFALPPLFGAMRTSKLLSRARAAPEIGAGVLVPDDVDAAAISLANWVKDSFGVTGSDHVVDDLRVLVGHGGLRPDVLAERLEEHRLRRVGILAFDALRTRDAAMDAWLRALRPSPLELAWSRRARHAILAVAAHHHYASFVLVRSASDSWAGALASVAFGVARGIRDEIRHWRGDPRHARRWVR